jgi:hypothetical protein
LLPNGSGEEKFMTEYPALVAREKELFMFYNGDNYGKNGILLARANF